MVFSRGYLVIAKESKNTERFIMTYATSSDEWELKSLDDNKRKVPPTNIESQDLRDTFKKLYDRII